MPKPTLIKNDLVILINENIKLLNELDKSININFIKNSKKIILECDKEQISRVFLNLIKNSIESIHQRSENGNDFNKKITIELSESNVQISMIITDNGVGFSSYNNNIKDALNPYITTKKMVQDWAYRLLIKL